MSLLRLLTAGKSLVGLKDYRSRYVNHAGALPKFGSKKNPFRATTRPDCVASAEAKRPSVETVSEPESSSAKEGCPPQLEAEADSMKASPPGVEEVAIGKNGRSTEIVHPAPRSEPASLASARADMSFDWSKVLFWRRPTPARQAVPRFGKPMVQAELSLDGVKVVRNDLSDTDLEIVLSKPPAPAITQTPVKTNPETSPPVETAWGRMAGRIFRADKL